VYWRRLGLHPGKGSRFSLSQNVQTRSGRLKLTAHLHLVPWLRMNGVIALLSLYTVSCWTIIDIVESVQILLRDQCDY
jgi:hypothetical protein